MRPTYPATKYFSDELLPPAQAIETDNQQELARLLTPTLPKTAPDGMTLLLYAMMNRRKECMQVLLTHGIDPNQQTLLGQDREQAQAVGLAAGGEDLAILRVLLDHGGNPNSQYQHIPALIQAAEADRFDQMRLLLEHGAAINGQAPDGRTAAIVLADNARFDQVAYLIKQGADI
ncbi:MAG: ankyrin repeat domain-containing protein [Janthinobacterium lividum]